MLRHVHTAHDKSTQVKCGKCGTFCVDDGALKAPDERKHQKKFPFVCQDVSGGYHCLKPFPTKGEFEKHQTAHRRGTLKKKIGLPKYEMKMLRELRTADVVPRMPATHVQYIPPDGIARPPGSNPNAPVLFFECDENQHRGARYSEHDEPRRIRVMRAWVDREYGVRKQFILIRFNPNGIWRINGFEQVAFRNEDEPLEELIRFAKHVQSTSYSQAKRARLHVTCYDTEECGRPLLFNSPSFVHENNPIATCFNPCECWILFAVKRILGK